MENKKGKKNPDDVPALLFMGFVMTIVVTLIVINQLS